MSESTSGVDGTVNHSTASSGAPSPALAPSTPEPSGLKRPIDVKVPGEPTTPQKPFNIPDSRTYNDKPIPRDPSAPKKKKGGKHRFGMSYSGRFVYDDLDNLPPIELDKDGFPIRPKAVSFKRRRNFNEDERKVRFVLMWSYTGGNVMLSCQEAGITRQVYDEWTKTDERFSRRLEEAKQDIGDRLQLRLAQRVGLLPMPVGLRLHDSALFGMVKKYRPGLFAEGVQEGDGIPPEPESHIPRPPR